MTEPLDASQQNQLAKAIQDAVPFAHAPFDEIASTLGFDADVVISQLVAWRDEKKLREISGVLEGSALGYDSALVAAAVPAERIDEVAAIISEHPTVTHNYRRNHEFNLWFTIAVPESVGLGATLNALERATGVAALHPMRRTATYKIGVNFDLESLQSTMAAREIHAVAPVALDDRARRLFRALQAPLTIEPHPFVTLATAFGSTEDELLGFATQHLGGALRRYVGTFRHRALGVRGNGMVVWNVPTERADAVGRQLAAAPEVTHCYARTAIPGFPYTVYSMVHGADESSCRAVATALSEQVGVRDYRILFSTHEYKKCRLRYFLPELDAWNRAHLA